ncbi:WD40 repeat-like protein, partial [Piedraia hortae CBS 480.64]
CLNDTRVDILADIVQWAASLGNPKIFWLRGKAGTGKTTIARTVARKLDGEIVGGEKCIVASFFFKRGGGNLERIAYLVPTVARQLADTMSSLATGIANALREDSQLPGANMDYQFRYLLQAPCEAISQGRVNRTRIIIVIDSLDECDDAKGIETLLPLLGTLVKIHSTNLQVLVTSRPDRIIEDTFDTMDSTLCTRMDLDDAQEMSIGQDMRKFFIAEFAKIRGRPSVRRLANLGEDWPGETNIEALVQQSKPVFIVASTICRYIDTANPQGRLQDLFTQRSDNLTSRLEQLYLPILRHASIDADGQKNYHWEPLFESIVKPLILLNQPLSLRALAELLDCSPAEVREALDPLYSVIQVPIEDSKPITTYHLSFRDCLVNLHDKAQAQFRINEKETHRVLLERCLELLRSSFLQHGLSEGVVGGGICGPMCPGTSRKRISRDQIDSHISEAVRYAACNWCSHLIKLNPGLIELENVDEFLKRHFLHWIECMSWLGKIKDAISIVNQLRLHAQDNRTHDFKAFLEDAIRWIAAFQDLVSTTPLQTYLAALVRSPSKSIVRARFNHLIEQNLDMCFSRHDDWGPLQQRIRYGDSVSCVAISPDNKTVAAGLYNGNVRLWDTDMNTDAELYWVKNGRSHIHELRFLPDGRNLSMSSLDCALIINMLTKEVKVLFDRSKDSSQICGISPDAQLAAVDSQGVITLHNLRTKTKQLDISKERRPGSPVVFSPDSGTVVSSLTDCSVKIWSTSSGDEVASLEEHSDDISCLAFSPNGSRLASGCESGTICLWNTSTWSQEWVFDGNTALQFTFSPEGETLALAGICEPFFLLNAETGEEEVSSEIDIDGCTAFALSSGGRKLVVGNEAGDLRVLDARIEPRFQTTMIGAEITAMGHADSVKVIKMSPDGQLLATGSHDASVRLWDTHNWKQISLMKGHTSTISTLAFTLNGDMIASGSEDCTVRIWNTKSGEQMSIFTGHVEKLITAAVSPVDDTVASSDATGDVRLWDAKGGNQ